MSKQTNFFLLLAVIAIFSACNNTNKLSEDVKRTSQDASSNSAEKMAISDKQEAKLMKEKGREKASISSNKASDKEVNKPSDNSKITDLNSTTANRVNTNSTPMTDAEKMRQIAAEKKRNTESVNVANKIIDATPAPGKVEQVAEKAKSTIKNTKVPTPTVSTPTQEAPKKIEGAPAHDDWNTLLSANVSSAGKVNYKGFRASQAKLNTYLDKLKSNPPVASWSRNEKMAYWINAYNAFTVKKILDNYPLSSIQELSGGKVWDDKWINIGDKTYSLNNIENDILRPTYKDARIHFAVNCAAKSCPSLHNHAFTAANLESKLAQLTKKFVNNADFNTITADKVTVSKIFDWYSADFGDLKAFLNKYSNTPINADAAVDYTEYNWSLNE